VRARPQVFSIFFPPALQAFPVIMWPGFILQAEYDPLALFYFSSVKSQDQRRLLFPKLFLSLSMGNSFGVLDTRMVATCLCIAGDWQMNTFLYEKVPFLLDHLRVRSSWFLLFLSGRITARPTPHRVCLAFTDYHVVFLWFVDRVTIRAASSR